MYKKSGLNLTACLLGAAALVAGTQAGRAQTAPDHPSVTVHGETYSPASILARNMGTVEDRATQFPPHKIIGNIYYVGLNTLASYLIVTPQGNILIDSTYEKNVPTIQKSVEQLGFKFSDIKILLGNHAHPDHQEGDAMVKQLTGAQVVVMAEDVDQLRNLKPEGKEHPIDRIIHDGDTVSLGGVVLTAHLTAGHTRGCTTWTMTAQDGGKSYNVMFGCSLRAPAKVSPEVADELARSFKTVRALPCDVPLGDHPAQFNLDEKYRMMVPGGANPFIDPGHCSQEADVEEAMLHAILAEQDKAAHP